MKKQFISLMILAISVVPLGCFRRSSQPEITCENYLYESKVVVNEIQSMYSQVRPNRHGLYPKFNESNIKHLRDKFQSYMQLCQTGSLSVEDKNILGEELYSLSIQLLQETKTSIDFANSF